MVAAVLSEREGRSKRFIRRRGLWFSPGEKHRLGAGPTTAMTHIAIQEKLDGEVFDWMEHVSDEQNKC
jgi:hypothetical protein